MTPSDAEKYADLKRIFNAVMALDKAERKRFLDKECPQPETRSQIEKMIAAAENEDHKIEEGVLSQISELTMPAAIGEYRPIKEIGHGGMGIVYEAVRETQDFTQRVALKAVNSGINSDILLNSFRSEQKILASLEHPNIARFLDGGRMANGAPFYAMEYVEGLPIEIYCREQCKSIDEKLEIFRQICSAVSYAHSQLVVHRDLKPSNILVKNDGTPKLLDFGIAKILDIEGNDAATATQFGMMTPQYASPEQIRGEKVTTLSDVYSLGIILYELLTGRRPYEFHGKTFAEMISIVTTSEAIRPSYDPAAARTDPIIRGDLDNIILKAIEKDPERRYSSVEQFSEDIRRHLEGVPVSARAASWSYRFSKFTKRNRTAVIAAAIIFITLLAGVAVSTLLAVRAETQRALAEKRFAEVRKLANNVVFKYNDELAKIEGSTGVRQMLVSDATEYLDDLAKDAGDDADFQHELARAYIKLGDVQGKMYSMNTGDRAGALESYAKAVGLLESIMSRSLDPSAGDDLLYAYEQLLISSGRTAMNRADSNAMLERSGQLVEQLAIADPNDLKRQHQLISYYISLGDGIGQEGETEKLKQKYEIHSRALAPLSILQNTAPDDEKTLRATARLNQRLGADQLWIADAIAKNDPEANVSDHLSKALEHHLKTFESTERLSQIFPGNNEIKLYRLLAMNSYAESLSRNGRFDEAEKMADEIIKDMKEMAREDPKNREASFNLSLAYELRAGISHDRQNAAAEMSFIRSAMDLQRALAAADNGNAEFLTHLAQNNERLAELAKQNADHDASAALIRDAERYRTLIRRYREVPQ